MPLAPGWAGGSVRPVGHPARVTRDRLRAAGYLPRASESHGDCVTVTGRLTAAQAAAAAAPGWAGPGPALWRTVRRGESDSESVGGRGGGGQRLLYHD